MTAPVLSISYTLKPPTSTHTPPHLSPTSTHEFPIHAQSESGSPSKPLNAGDAKSAHYYDALREAIARAKDVTGRELTEWRDAVGAGEKDKAGGRDEKLELAGGEELEGDDEE